MKRFSNALLSLAAIFAIGLGVAASADAQTRNQREVRDLVRSLTAQVDDFQYGLEYELRNNSAGSRSNADELNNGLRQLQDAVSSFDDNFQSKRENRNDVNDIIAAASVVERSLSSISLNRRLETDWQDVKKNITSLGANYGVVARFDGRMPSSTTASNNSQNDAWDRPQQTAANLNAGLTGTYSLDAGRSENINDILTNTGVSASNRVDLQSKLEAPEQIALDVRGNQVTLASSKASPVTIIADGSEKVENSNGLVKSLWPVQIGGSSTVLTRALALTGARVTSFDLRALPAFAAARWAGLIARLTSRISVRGEEKCILGRTPAGHVSRKRSKVSRMSSRSGLRHQKC